MVLWKKPDGAIVFATNCAGVPKPSNGDTILTFGPAKPEKTVQEEKETIPDPAIPG